MKKLKENSDEINNLLTVQKSLLLKIDYQQMKND